MTDGFGGMLSLLIKGSAADAVRVCTRLRVIIPATSLGGVESLVAYPLTMSHAAMSEEARERAGIGPGLLRVSVGIEDVDDLAADFRFALDRALAATAEAVRC